MLVLTFNPTNKLKQKAYEHGDTFRKQVLKNLERFGIVKW